MAEEKESRHPQKIWKVRAGVKILKEPSLRLAVKGPSEQYAEVKARTFFPEFNDFECEGSIDEIDASTVSWLVRELAYVERDLEQQRAA